MRVAKGMWTSRWRFPAPPFASSGFRRFKRLRQTQRRVLHACRGRGYDALFQGLEGTSVSVPIGVSSCGVISRRLTRLVRRNGHRNDLFYWPPA